MIIARKAAYGAAALLFAAGGMTAASGAAAAAPGAPAAHAATAGWKCYVGHSSVPWAECEKGSKWVRAEYARKGQLLYIYDHFGNNHRTVAYVKVGGSGTARFYGPYKKDGTYKKIHVHYTKGKSIKVKVCTSVSSHAVCSGYSNAGKT